MPQIIDHIDAIARQKQRDVLYVVFRPVSQSQPGSDWEEHPTRNAIIQWLDEKNMPWRPCAGVANVNQLVSYQGQIYIDVPFDSTLPQYAELAAYLENPDGTMRLPGAVLAYLPLEHALQNAEHDEPGFWARWAEDF